MHYIYLNTYQTKSGELYYYVGSHKWKGDGVDPDYKGTSSVAKHYGWSPINIQILEVVDSLPKEQRLRREGELIREHCSKYGIADCALLLASKTGNSILPDFVSKYKPHGLMLNLHSNSMEQAYHKGLVKCKSSEVRKIANAKAFQTQLSNGQFNRLIESSHTPEAIKKSVETRKASGSLSVWFEALNSEEAKEKRKEHKRTVPNYGRHKDIEVYKEGVLVCSGNMTKCCKKLGHSNWQAGMSQKIRTGLTEFDYWDYHIKVLPFYDPEVSISQNGVVLYTGVLSLGVLQLNLYLAEVLKALKRKPSVLFRGYRITIENK